MELTALTERSLPLLLATGDLHTVRTTVQEWNTATAQLNKRLDADDQLTEVHLDDATKSWWALRSGS